MGTTKLHNALLTGKGSAALALIEAGGIDLNAQDDVGRTALMLAAAQSFNKVVAKLLEKDVRTALTDKFNHTALEMARDGGNEEGRNMLYRRLGPAELQAEAIHAAREGDIDALRFLVDEMDVSLSAVSSRGKTALEEAEVSTQLDAAEWIEQKLADFPAKAGRDMHKGVNASMKPLKKIIFKNS